MSPRVTMKILFLILFTGYAVVCFIAYLIQARLVFFPNDERVGTPEDAGLDFRDCIFQNARGNTLHGWYVISPGSTFTLLYCHGNAGNITHRIGAIKQLVDAGFSVFIFDYSGYGRSEGKPSEEMTYDDAMAAYAHVMKEYVLGANEIILFGRSLGAAVAIDLATRVKAAALIVESSFTSMPEMGARTYPWLPVRVLARIRYDSMRKIQRANMPKLFVHSLDDEVVPYGMGRRLYNRAQRPKQFIKIRGGHSDAYLTPGSEYEASLRSFVAGLDVPFPGPTPVADRD